MLARIIGSFTFIYSQFYHQVKPHELQDKEKQQIEEDLNWRNLTPKFGTVVVLV